MNKSLATVIFLFMCIMHTTLFGCPHFLETRNSQLDTDSGQLFLGAYTESVTLLGTGLQVASGFLGVDIIGDVRDLIHDVTNWEWTWGHAGQTLLDGIGLIPILGMAKYGDEAWDLMRNVNGTTVLGKFPDYINMSDSLNARRFEIPDNIWQGMSDAERWGANQKFLDRAILRGDDIILSNPIHNINDISGYFRMEVDYLLQQGYRISNDGTRMIR